MFSDAALGGRRKRALRGRSVKRHRVGMLAEEVRAGDAREWRLEGAMASALAAQVANRER